MDNTTAHHHHTPSADPSWLLRVLVHLPLLFLTLARGGDASCPQELRNSCTNAVREDKLGELEGGGECQLKTYNVYTHVCTVTTTEPFEEQYCCCGFEKRTMCCLYHQDWNYYRCIEGVDTVDILDDDKLPQELLLTAILVPTAAALCCLVCCVRCICCRDDEDDSHCACSKCTDSSHQFTFGRSRRYQDVQQALNSTTNGVTSEKLPLPHKGDAFRDMMTSPLPNGGVTSSAVPSAPPLEDVPFSQLLSPTQRPSSTVILPPGDAPPNTSYILHYVPISANQRPQSGVIECTYQEIRPQASTASTSLPPYQKYDARFPGNSCYGNPNQKQTLIGILTNEEGRPILGDVSEPREPPPTYEDASGDALRKSSTDAGSGDKEC